MRARIYQPAKTAMQSGTAKTRKWIVEFMPPASPFGVGETMTQVRLTFHNLDDARAYAAKQGLAYHVITPQKRKNISKSYSDNFRYDRTVAWTH